MWKRDEAAKREERGSATTPTAAGKVASDASHAVGSIGRSISIKGELSAREDVVIDGILRGRVDVPEHVVTLGAGARIEAEVVGRSVIVLGQLIGSITAAERVQIMDGGSVDGDIVSPRIAISEGAQFRGTVDISPRVASAQAPSRIPVEVYLPTADPLTDHRQLEELQRAVEELLGLFGYIPEPETVSLVLRSWHWKEWFRRNQPQIKQEATEVYDGLKEALTRQQIDIAGATAFEKRATAAAALLKTLESIEVAAVRLGDVVVVKHKVNGQIRVVVETLSPPMARELERNPLLMRDPEAVVALLEEKSVDPPAA